MIGDDDVCLPGRLRRQLEVFDRYPDTGVVHGDSIVIDSGGRQTGSGSFPDKVSLEFSHRPEKMKDQL